MAIPANIDDLVNQRVVEHEGSPVHPVKGVPQDAIDGILKQLVGLCHKIEPLYNPIVELVLYEDAYLIIIIIWMPGGYGRPYKAAQDVLASKSNYRHYILQLLDEEPCSLTELSRRMGYKSISKRLSSTVEEMVGLGTIKRVANLAGRGVISPLLCHSFYRLPAAANAQGQAGAPLPTMTLFAEVTRPWGARQKG